MASQQTPPHVCQEKYSLADAKLPLTPENYRKKFQALIYFEEQEHSRLLKEKCDGHYCVKAVPQEYHWFQDNVDAYFCIYGLLPRQIVYASQASSEVCIKCSSSQEVKAIVVFSPEHYDSGNDVLYIATEYPNDTAILNNCLKHERKEIKIKFQVKHSYFDDLIKSVSKISEEAIARIVPSVNDFEYGLELKRIPRSPFRVNQLDRFQLKALRTMLFSKSTAPVLVPGPFGTGKTRLLSVASEYFVRNAKFKGKLCRILLCCHHQNSADNFMREYFLKMLNDEKNPWQQANVIRIASRTHLRSDFSNKHDLLVGDFFRTIDIHSQDHIVIVTTFLTALRMVDRIPPGYFTHILIDEGAQAREPECIAPLCMADRNTRIIIVGDEKQVGPKLVVLGKIAQENGLGESLLERLNVSYMKIEKARKYSVTLRNNYRCVADILHLPSKLFYESRLIPRARVHKIRNFSLVFICSSISKQPLSMCESEPEARIVVQEIENIISKEHIISNRICIISSSQRQVSLIKKLMFQKRLKGIKVLSSYQMQGQEFDVLVLSTVESVYSDGRPFDQLKSLCHPAVFNTAITRARSLVVAVGNPFTLKRCEKTIGCYGCWNVFISKCKSKNTYDDRQCPRFSTVHDDFSIARSTPRRSEKRNYRRQFSATAEDVGRGRTFQPPACTPVQLPVSLPLATPLPLMPQLQHGTIPSTGQHLHNNPSFKNGIGHKIQPTITSSGFTQQNSRYTLADAKLPLTVENYRKKFNALIHFEEKEHIKLLAEHCDGQYDLCNAPSEEFLNMNFDSFFKICGMTPNQILYASQASSEVYIDCHSIGRVKTFIIFGHHRYDHEVLCVGSNGLNAIKLRQYLNQNGKKKFEMKFGIKYSYFANLEKSVNTIGLEAIKRIVPSENHFEKGLDLSRIPKSPFSVNELDPFQFKALQTMAFSKSTAPVLVPGPFGTGKTKLLSVASEYFITNAKTEKINCRILLCCHHQDSADIFMINYFLKMLEDKTNPWKVKVIRVVSQAHQKRTSNQYEVVFNIFKEQWKLYQANDHLVIVTTFMTALRMSEFIPPGHFTHILIDEGAQAREPECIAPLCMADEKTHIVIVGDSKQVGPKLLVLGKIPQENGLGRSLLERLDKSYMQFKHANNYSVNLCRNYRCVADILKLPSCLFYQSSLIPCANEPSISKYPLKFICSKKSPQESCESINEAEVIIQELSNILSKDVKPSRVCVMCTSQIQISVIRRLIWQKPQLRIVKILSTYQMQGQEFDVLLLSTVESITSNGKPFDPLKSLSHPAVFNTAITRAKALIVAVGHPSTLMTSESMIGSTVECWKEFISRCKSHGTYYEEGSHSVTVMFNNIDGCTTNTYNDVSSTAKLNKEKLQVQETVAKGSSKVWAKTAIVKANNDHLKESNASKNKSENRSERKHQVLSKSSTLKEQPCSPNVTANEGKKSSLRKQGSWNIKTPSSKSKEKLGNSNRQQILASTFKLADYMSGAEVEKLKWSKNDAKDFKHTHRSIDEGLLKQTLTRKNYREKFHQLLCREEEEHAKILKERCDGIYDLFYIYHHGFDGQNFKDAKDDHVRFGYVTADHLDGDKIAYATQASEGKVLIKFQGASGKMNEKKLDIVGTKDNKIILGTKDESNLKACGISFLNVEVKFILKYSYFDRLHDGLDNLSDEIISKLLPECSTEFSGEVNTHYKMHMIDSVTDIINLSDHIENPQTFALKSILKADPLKAPVLIAGSFGTGKTRLLARAAYQILYNDRKHAKVLVCAHHQKSADTFIENYFGKMIENGWRCDKMIRLVPTKRYKVPEMKYRKYYKTVYELMKFISKDEIKLLVTTFSTSGHLIDYLGKHHFTHILLDEGAQTREPESVIPLGLANKNTSIVIAGDHKQVGPSILVLGDKARDNGLKFSLLERLHNLYSKEELLKASNSHCVSLLTNFRSHHALLSLPSYLFYGSALVTVAKSTNELHPDAQYPLKFVCSSLNDTIEEVKESTNEKEVNMILEEVKKYIEIWPKEWGQKDLKEICVMATTTNQKYAFTRCLRNHHAYKSIKFVEVLTVYDIQGREFRAIFLSTAEPIESGRSKNPTKSPCGQFVFNTAITRAKSLVVCAGNPFLLMKVEEKMEKIDVDKSFWKDYLRRCITTKSFHVPSLSKYKDKLDELQKLVFSSDMDENVISSFHDRKSDDTIIKRLEKFVSNRYNYKECKFKIEEQQTEYQNWSIVKYETFNKGNTAVWNASAECSSREIIKCQLHVKSRRDAVAIPLHSQQDAIVINGFDNRRGAFDGDLVAVSVIEDDGKKYGKVVNVDEFHHPTKYVCTADKQDVIYFYPIDKLVPCIVNLPKISRKILQHKLEEFGEFQKDYISVFDESTLDIDKDLSLKIKELIPLEMAPSLLFVVKVLNWSPKFRKPLGAVIEALPQTNNPFIIEKLLLVAHDIQCNEISSNDFAMDKPISSTTDEQQLKVYKSGITIDPSDACNFDDALIIVPLQKADTYELAVLITDVANYIQKGDQLDGIAKSRGISVYPGQLKHQSPTAMHMLPLDYAKEKLSLCGKDVRRVIAVSAEVRLHNGEVIDVRKGNPLEAMLESSVNLTYNSSQCIMNGNDMMHQEPIRKFDSTNELCLRKALRLLFKIAMKIRVDRLSDAAYNYRISDPEEEENWQSHLMVEELMIWANSHVAEYMIEECPDTAIVRCQFPPLTKELCDVREAHMQFLNYSLCYRSLLSDDNTDATTIADHSGLVLTSTTIENLRRAYEANDLLKIGRILSNEMNFPQLAMIEGAMISISKSAQYACTKHLVAQDPNVDPFNHYNIKRHYTHFSSPIRRYFDIVVQRIIKALIEKKDLPYTISELETICRMLNLKFKNSKRYSKSIDRALMASQWEDEGMQEAAAYVTCSLQKKHRFHLCFPLGQLNEFMMREDTSFDFSQLNYHKREENIVTWQVVTVPLDNPDYLTKCPSLNWGTPILGNGEVIVNYFPEIIGSEQGDRKHKIQSLAIKNNNKIVGLEAWKVAQKFVKNPTRENIEEFMSVLDTPSSEEPFSQQTDTSGADASMPPVDIIDSPLLQYTVKTKFGGGCPVKVWISKSLKQPISSPGLALIEVAPTVRICLQHIQNPVECFSNTRLELSSRSEYKSEEEYVDLWCKALLAEGSNDGVKAKKIILLKGASLQWPKLVRSETSIDKVYFKPNGSLRLTICLEKFNMMDLLGIRAGDLVCARYEVPNGKMGKLIQEVYHFCVTRVYIQDKYKNNVQDSRDGRRSMARKDGNKEMAGEDELVEEDMILLFESYGEHGCKVSENMEHLLKSNPACELQIMKMPISFTRLFERLQSLKKASELVAHKNDNTKMVLPHEEWKKLAVNVALGSHYSFIIRPPEKKDVYKEIFGIDKLARCLWDSEGQLNEMQLQAIEHALEHTFHLIQGPPGTGKSVTGAHLAYIFARGNRKVKKDQCVLYCGPSNKAVDVVHDQLLKVNKRLNGNKLKILRLYGRTHERKEYPDPIMKVLNMHVDETIDSICAEKFKLDTLHYKIRDKNPKLKKKEDDIRNSVSRDKTIPSAAIRKSYRLLIQECEEKELQKPCDIILCTCNETCSNRLLKAVQRNYSKSQVPPRDAIPLIAQCIVDESGMANEPETLAAISKCEHAVLIGDHMQLQPVVKYSAAKDCGLSTSLFERYAKNDDDTLLTLLDTQYRMHQCICEGPSEIFYNGNLKTAQSVKDRASLKQLNTFFKGRYPIRFYDIEGKEESGLKDTSMHIANVEGKEESNTSVHTANVDAHSKYNMEEAKKAVHEIQTLLKYSLKESSIAVLTPYTAQKNKIRDLLKTKNIKDVKVLSIVESQGDEYDVVILSTVRSQPRKQIKVHDYIQPDRRWRRENLGFLMDPHQLNVAITRAKYGLIIIGNRTLLKYDETWRDLIAKYEKYNCVDLLP